jgi:hypothetical protein
MEIGAILGLHGLKASRNKISGWRISTFEVRQTGQTGVATLRTVKTLIPFIDHWATPFLGEVAVRAPVHCGAV